MQEEPIHLVTDRLPDPMESVRVWLEDGTREAATWTGLVWWGWQKEVHPVRWQRMPMPGFAHLQ